MYAHLCANVALAALVGTRIYPEILPQDVVYPCMRYARVGTIRGLMLDGVNTLTEVRMQIDIWARSYAEIRAIGNALRAALDGVTGNLGGVSIQFSRYEADIDLSELEGDQRERRRSFDFIFTLHE